MAEPNRNPQSRPDPDALLAIAGGDGRGKLTLFLGAAPGVGKTFAMLARAQRLKAAGIDIIVGLAETHGRSETAQLLEGLEVLPRRKVEYQGRAIEEFDIDAALRRRPSIIVVDELAHTNAPDSRHPKRYLDVEELLSAGIDGLVGNEHPAPRKPGGCSGADNQRASPGARTRYGPAKSG